MLTDPSQRHEREKKRPPRKSGPVNRWIYNLAVGPSVTLRILNVLLYLMDLAAGRFVEAHLHELQTVVVVVPKVLCQLFDVKNPEIAE